MNIPNPYTSQTWLDAIHTATECLRNVSNFSHQQFHHQNSDPTDDRHHGRNGSNNHNNAGGDTRNNDDEHMLLSQLECSLQYLKRLEDILLKECTRSIRTNDSNNVNATTNTTTTTTPTSNTTTSDSDEGVGSGNMNSSTPSNHQPTNDAAAAAVSGTQQNTEANRWSELPRYPPPIYDRFMQRELGRNNNRNFRNNGRQRFNRRRNNGRNNPARNGQHPTAGSPPTNVIHIRTDGETTNHGNNDDANIASTHHNRNGDNRNRNGRNNNNNNNNSNGEGVRNDNIWGIPGQRNYNLYAAAFADYVDDDEDDDDVDEVEGGLDGNIGNTSSHIHTLVDDADAGDTPVLNYHGSQQQNVQQDDVTASMYLLMDRRRLLIRILTLQSDFYCYLAILYVNRTQIRQWLTGATNCTTGLKCIHKALMFADTQISYMIASSSNDDNRRAMAYQEDSDIVTTAIEGLTRQRDKYSQLALSQKLYIESKLRPQHEARDEVKQRMGAERWNNNPRPRNHFANQRKNLEMELKDVQGGITVIESPANDVTIVIEKNNRVKQRLISYMNRRRTNTRNSRNNNRSNQRNASNRTTRTTSQNANPDVITSLTTAMAAATIANPEHNTIDEIVTERYNSIRLMETYQQPRVSLKLFPDPSSFGWTFTGTGTISGSDNMTMYNNNNDQQEPVEYYEQALDSSVLSNASYQYLMIPRSDNSQNDYYIIPMILLDWYSTTATITIRVVYYHYLREGDTSNCITKSQIHVNRLIVTHQQYCDLLQNPLSLS